MWITTAVQFLHISLPSSTSAGSRGAFDAAEAIIRAGSGAEASPTTRTRHVPRLVWHTMCTVWMADKTSVDNTLGMNARSATLLVRGGENTMTINDHLPQVSHDLDPVEVAKYIVSRDAERPEPDITQLKLQKLLYLVQANYLAATGHRLVAAHVEAFDHGPVIDKVRIAFRSYGKTVIAPELQDWKPVMVPPDARTFIDAVWNRYKDLSASQLYRLTHAQAPWRDNYVEGNMHTEIPDQEISTFFRDHVSIVERSFHPDAVVLDRDALDELDAEEDAIVARAAAAFA